ncbi:MAG: DNA internalization-related competence protein ComEC/Rec2 [Myxococcota bacterium]
MPIQPAACTLEGTVARVSAGPTWATVDLEAVVPVDCARRAVPERVRLRAEPTAPGAVGIDAQLPGARVRARVRLRAPSERRHPGARSRLRALERAGLGAEARLVHPALYARIPDRESWRPLAALHARRRQWGLRIEAAGEGGALLRALVLGDRRGLSHDRREDFARIGVSHILAVSGLHLSLAAALCYAFARRVAFRSASLTARSDARIPALAAAALAAVVYALLAGWGVPVRRALVLLLALAVAVVKGRPGTLLPPLSAAALVVLAWQPQALFEAGPQLSFAASYALGVAARRRPASRASAEGAVGARLVDALRSSAAAIAVTAPLAALHLGRVAPFALLANLVAIPWTALVLLPASALALAAAALPAGPFSDAVLAWAVVPARLTGAFAADLAQRLPVPPAALAPGVGTWLCVAAGVAVSLSARSTGARVASAVAVSALLALAPPAPVLPPPPRVIFFEVGQGDAALVDGGDAAVLIDAGTAFSGGIDLGAQTVVPALAALGIRRLDLAIVTHADLDHRGGMPAVLRALPVGALWLPFGGRGEPAFGGLLLAAEAMGVPVHERGAGSPPAEIGSLRIAPLWPPRGAAGARRNDRSLVVRIDVSGRRVLLPGDVEAGAELVLAARGDALRADIVKLAHHGSRTSSTARFLAATDASVAIVSAPRRGRFGMPHAAVKERARRQDLSLWWTGRDGAVMVSLGEPLAVWGYAEAPAP